MAVDAGSAATRGVEDVLRELRGAGPPVGVIAAELLEAAE